MDELDRERSTAQVLAAAGTAAALFAGLALAITRKRDEAADAEEGDGLATASAAADAVAAAPEQARRLRDRLPRPNRPELDRVLPLDAASGVAERLKAAAAAMPHLAGANAATVDLGSLSPAQAAAARAAAAAVAKAEQALEAVGGGRGRTPEVSQETVDEATHHLREVAQQAAELALGLWQSTRERAASTRLPGVAETVEGVGASVGEAAHVAGASAREAAHGAAERTQELVHDVAEKAHDLGEKAKRGARDAAETTAETSKETASALAWLVAVVTVVVYVLLKPERRETLTKFFAEATAQTQELLRDFRGYDDEF